MEKFIYFIAEEHSAGTDSCQHGAWFDPLKAKDKLKELVEKNEYGHFCEESNIDYENGTAYSNNNDDDYTQYTIEKLPVNDYHPLVDFIRQEVEFRYKNDVISGINTYDQKLISNEFLECAASELCEDNDIMFDYDKIDNKLFEIYTDYNSK